MRAATGLNTSLLLGKLLLHLHAPCTTAALAPRFRHRHSTALQGDRLGSSRCRDRQIVSVFGRDHLHAMAAVQSEAPPADIKLDRSAFTEVLKLKALRVPTSRCQELMKRFTGCANRLRGRRKTLSARVLKIPPVSSPPCLDACVLLNSGSLFGNHGRVASCQTRTARTRVSFCWLHQSKTQVIIVTSSTVGRGLVHCRNVR